MSTFLIIDFFRDNDFSIVLLSRIVVLSIAAILMASTFRKPLNPNFVPFGIVIIAFINFGAALTTATYARMPPYYLTNLLFLIWVLVIAISGLNFRHGLFLNILLFAIFISYSQWVRRDAYFFSQYPHLFVSFTYFLIVNVVLEYRRRNNFLQFTELAEQKRKVEELNQQKNKIISILSHDVASPLNSLSGLLNLQMRGKFDENEFRPFMKQIGDQLKNVSGLLFGLVRWSRAQMEGFVTEKKSIDLNRQLETHVELFQPLAGEKNIELKLSLAPTLVSVADEEMIRIAVRSLISNAVKFSNRGGIINIEGFMISANRVGIRISNEGVSIPAHLREKLFTYQMPSSEGTAGERGTGLGLAMAAFFVRFNGGEIFLEPSAEGKTVFRIELPSSVPQELN